MSQRELMLPTIDASQFTDLFLNEIPLIDVRTPAEFAQGAFSTAINLPLLSDHERAQVGLCYAKKGQAAAIELGLSLVSGEVKKARIQSWCDFAEKHPAAVLYCWRGGLRSEIAGQWMLEAGRPCSRVAGGFKALRQFLLEQMNALCQTTDFVVLGGRTGSAKTKILKDVPCALDLEQIANHRGSAFGYLPTP